MIVKIEENMFYSHGDEARFFRGLEKNPAVKDVRAVAQGRTGRVLAVRIDARALDKTALWDLIALCRRYEVPLRPFAVLARRKKFPWLKQKRMYWYASMFGRGGRARKG